MSEAVFYTVVKLDPLAVNLNISHHYPRRNTVHSFTELASARSRRTMLENRFGGEYGILQTTIPEDDEVRYTWV